MSRITMDWSGPEPVAVYNGRMWHPAVQWWNDMMWADMAWTEEEKISIKVGIRLLITLSTRSCLLDKVFKAIEYDQEHGEHLQWAEVEEVQPECYPLDGQVSFVMDSEGCITLEEA